MALGATAIGLAETDPAEAVRLADEAATFRDVIRTDIAAMRNFDGMKGRALIMQGDRSGLAAYGGGLDAAIANGDRMVIRSSVMGVMEACAVLGEDEHAAELAGGLHAACGELGALYGPFAARDEEVRARMLPARYEAARARAAAWDWSELVEQARTIIDEVGRAR
jgi:hypothetical protein